MSETVEPVEPGKGSGKPSVHTGDRVPDGGGSASGTVGAVKISRQGFAVFIRGAGAAYGRQRRTRRNQIRREPEEKAAALSSDRIRLAGREIQLGIPGQIWSNAGERGVSAAGDLDHCEETPAFHSRSLASEPEIRGTAAPD